MRTWFVRLGAAFLIVTVLASAIGFWAIRQTRYVPDFYRVAAEKHSADSSRKQTRQLRRSLDAKVQRLQDATVRKGHWHATFNNDEINNWLADELPNKFPHLLRRGLSEPRVAIVDGKLLAAARLVNARIDTIISCEIHVELTEQANLLAIRLDNLRAGSLPIPWMGFLERISSEAATGGVEIRWDDTDEGPIALLTVPSDHPEFVYKPVIVEAIQLLDGKISMAGRSGSDSQQLYQPRTSIHRFVSYRPESNSRCQTLLSRPPGPSKTMR